VFRISSFSLETISFDSWRDSQSKLPSWRDWWESMKWVILNLSTAVRDVRFGELTSCHVVHSRVVQLAGNFGGYFLRWGTVTNLQ
jgi:hypothetical protein